MREKLSYEELQRRVRELEETLERFSRQESSDRKKLDQLSRLSRIDGALRCSSDMDIVLWEVLGQVLDILRCDRVWIVYPCDPEAPVWGVRMERTNPEYPGVKGEAAEVAMRPEAADLLQAVLRARGVIVHGPEGHHLSDYLKRWRVQSQVAMTLRPEGDKPWLLGAHQCSYPRVWSPEEKEFLREAGNRIAMAMNQITSSLQGGGTGARWTKRAPCSWRPRSGLPRSWPR